jgi:acetylglutamate kinase
MKRTVIKLGGSVLIDPALRQSLTSQIATLVREGHQLILVHGGGKQIASLLERLGIPSAFHDGLRITDAATRDVVQMVLSGLVGRNLVAELAAAGLAPISLTGGDGSLALAEPIGSPDGVDLGYVGKITEVRPRIIDQLLSAGLTPVVACLALGGQDHAYYNVNGDQMAAAIAGGCAAETLVLVTDVGGVRGADGQTLSSLTPADVEDLLRSGVATGGMRPKLRACLEALAAGVKSVRIVGAADDRVLVRILAEAELLGTSLSATTPPQESPSNEAIEEGR